MWTKSNTGYTSKPYSEIKLDQAVKMVADLMARGTSKMVAILTAKDYNDVTLQDLFNAVEKKGMK